MTMKIEVTIPEDDVRAGKAAAYLSSAMEALGYYHRSHTVQAVGIDMPPVLAHPLTDSDRETLAAAGPGEVIYDPVVAEAPKRERGKPSPGRARRTKEEIAEDEAAEKAEAAAAPAEPKPAISTGEERIDPTNPDDAAQDAADEAAEAAAAPAKELTHEDLKAALMRYKDRYGYPATLEDGPKVFGMLFGPDVDKVSKVPGDQASLAKAVAGVEEMLVKNPFKREPEL